MNEVEISLFAFDLTATQTKIYYFLLIFMITYLLILDYFCKLLIIYVYLVNKRFCWLIMILYGLFTPTCSGKIHKKDFKYNNSASWKVPSLKDGIISNC